MKTKKNNVIAILVILSFVLLGAAYVLWQTKEKEQTAGPQVNDTGDSVTIEEQVGEETSEKKEGVFKKNNSTKQKKTNTNLKGGSETLEIIEQEDDKDTSGDTDKAPEYDMLPGIW